MESSKFLTFILSFFAGKRINITGCKNVIMMSTDVKYTMLKNASSIYSYISVANKVVCNTSITRMKNDYPIEMHTTTLKSYHSYILELRD